jgi:hypothetical protein
VSPVKLVLAAGLAAVSLSACGMTAKPEAGSVKAATTDHRRVDDPRATHVQCMREKHIPVYEFGRTWLQVGTVPYGPTIHFQPTPGAAQDMQITGQAQSAYVIGSAQVYPNQAPDDLLEKVETCLALGVSG